MSDTTEAPYRGGNDIKGDQRLMNLLHSFNSSNVPLTTSQIVGDSDMGYGSANVESDKKKFNRDRKRLAELGVVIRERRGPGAAENVDSQWVLDREVTHVAQGIITADDAEDLANALDEYLSRSDIPYRDALESARVKLTGAVERAVEHNAFKPRPENKVYAKLWEAFTQRLKIAFTYTDAKGNRSNKVVAIYGFFSLRGKCYFTAENEAGEIKNYRADRVRSPKKPKGDYTIPQDFSVGSYVFQPFDFNGGAPVKARFSFADGVNQEEIRTISRGRGEVSRDGDGRGLWSVDVRNLRAAAALALRHTSQGMKPVEPAALIDIYRDLITEAIEDHG